MELLASHTIWGGIKVDISELEVQLLDGGVSLLGFADLTVLLCG